jgi:hypothetical protein
MACPWEPLEKRSKADRADREIQSVIDEAESAGSSLGMVKERLWTRRRLEGAVT